MIYVTHDQKEALSMGSEITVMNKGEVIQTGTPRELYLQPKSTFLAEFIGDTNFIRKGTIESIDEKDTMQVSTPVGTIQVYHAPGKFKQGDKVCLSIRPESIKIDLGKHELSSKLNIVSGRLLRTIYLGEVEKLQILLTDHTILKVSLFNAPDYNVSVGDKITCFFKANKVVVLPENLT